MSEGEFQKLQEYIRKNAVKLPDDTPIFSARYFIDMIDKAKEEFPIYFKNGVPHHLKLRTLTKQKGQIETMKQIVKWFKKWFGEE